MKRFLRKLSVEKVTGPTSHNFVNQTVEGPLDTQQSMNVVMLAKRNARYVMTERTNRSLDTLHERIEMKALRTYNARLAAARRT